MTGDLFLVFVLGMGFATVILVPVSYYVIKEERRICQEKVDEVLKYDV